MRVITTVGIVEEKGAQLYAATSTTQALTVPETQALVKHLYATQVRLLR